MSHNIDGIVILLSFVVRCLKQEDTTQWDHEELFLLALLQYVLLLEYVAPHR
jgi:hypothetical protein